MDTARPVHPLRVHGESIRGLLLLLLLFVVQCSLLSCCLAHAAAAADAVDRDDPVVTATAGRGRRFLPSPALQLHSVQVNVAAHPWSKERRRSRRRRRRRAATLMAVSKHQVPTGANPDSN
ncbi:hypothetical protein [Oryza sativa Japonica Group]|uniref:Os01g0339400 protein n=2 Tax=Oryza sativa subsp. japonica TaxID=39947 RepID=A0A0N7KCW6_ORYSJ|nr:uncharacterized protein LOC4326802 [Oryza sativa Japonica Group]KAB8081287.1 hypothetical protein EE612_002355 [Oryza sativa]EEE54493.1 hypothetical protein OsJ_01614 [Oryza sativa Japonica Group]KAF2949978.1 hypothetical protein DAI22_01g157200 [Oryza sativa Japonica Group]BAD53135.1 hypothetical protein [Oryza sativa Japonica Group]BAF04859.1 Os01g0339400 [Oryza sativa Japonica Group]|eukprot:NP_001042945.1 Os01g0339400 [Oryza sativa Japonica Group]